MPLRNTNLYEFTNYECCESRTSSLRGGTTKQSLVWIGESLRIYELGICVRSFRVRPKGEYREVCELVLDMLVPRYSN
jgi:hypothetical protein